MFLLLWPEHPQMIIVNPLTPSLSNSWIHSSFLPEAGLTLEPVLVVKSSLSFRVIQLCACGHSLLIATCVENLSLASTNSIIVVSRLIVNRVPECYGYHNLIFVETYVLGKDVCSVWDIFAPEGSQLQLV